MQSPNHVFGIVQKNFRIFHDRRNTLLRMVFHDPVTESKTHPRIRDAAPFRKPDNSHPQNRYMKIHRLFTGAIALITLSFSTAAMADEEGAPGQKPAVEKGKGRPERPGGRGPGGANLTEEERLAAMKERLAGNEEMKKRLLERFDTDPKDGELSDAELKTALASFGNRGGRPPGADAGLTPEQRLTALKERLANNEEMKAKLLERFDTDPKDGELSDAELTKAMESFRSRAGGTRGEGRAKGKPEGKGDAAE